MWLEVGRYAGSNSKLSSVGSDWDKCFIMVVSGVTALWLRGGPWMEIPGISTTVNREGFCRDL